MRGKCSIRSRLMGGGRGFLFRSLTLYLHIFIPLKELDDLTDLSGMQGCGRGYDVVMLALHGFDAYGLEISATGVAEAEAFATEELRNLGEANFGVNYHGQFRGDVKFVQNDFFAPGWEGEIGGKFDLIYDYTVIPPLSLSACLSLC